MKIEVRELAGSKMAMGASNNGDGAQDSGNCLYANGLNGNSHDLQSEDEGPDDDVKAPSMFIADLEFNPGTLQGLSKLRKNRQFCDVLLQVGTWEIPAHRVILACCSPYLFELFSTDDGGKCSEENIITYKLNGGFEKDSLEHLINYAYTGRMEVAADKVKAVYVAASRLKMERVVNFCAQYLVDNLDPATAIEIRSLPGIQRNLELAARVDSFLASEISTVATTKALRNFPLVQVEVLATTREEMVLREAKVDLLCHLILEWIHRNWEPSQLNVEQLTAKTHLLYLNLDNCLHDCVDIESGDVIDSDIIQDYKKMSLRLSQPGSKNRRRGSAQQPSRSRHSLYSRSISELPSAGEAGKEEHEWRVVAATQMSEKSIMALTVINGRMTTLSVMQRLNNTISISNDAVVTPSSTPGQSRPPSVERSTDSISAIPHMSTPRCAVGCANLNNTLLVCGGYDRGECLRTVEQYDPTQNRWSKLPSMREARGRFDITVIDGKVYAVGGCNGTTELATAEVYSSENSKWTALPSLQLARSNVGVCDLGGKVYCVGGWNGQCGMKQCNAFDPVAIKWTDIAPLNYGRYQAAVTARLGKLYAVGGCDAWNCLNTVEVYDPESDVWDFLPPMNTARRGCGVTFYQNKLFVVGGSDGCQSLCTTEVFDFETGTWSPGPSMTSCRANISVAVIDGKLFAVGGFSGKVFLNSVEYLDPETMEWTTFVNRFADDARSEASSSSRRESQTNLATVDENGELKSTADSSGCESDEHSS
jgi:influenza virus NS1A-binding protein